MRILVDIGHPGHVHLFKNFARNMQENGHQLFFTCRKREFVVHLLESEGFCYKSFGRYRHTRTGKIFGLLRYNLLMLMVALRFKPDIFLSHGSIYAAQIAWLLGKPNISMEDTGNMEQIRLYRPFTKAMLVPYSLPQDFGPKQIKYQGVHELHYLHPHYFKPSSEIYTYLGIDENTPYCIMRFVSWGASHDYGQNGFSCEEKREIIDYLSSRMQIFITSEIPLPSEYRKYQIKIPPEKIHHALAFADLVVSEGATIASECAVLGTPAIYVNSLVCYYLEDQQQYGLVFNHRNGKHVLSRAKELIEDHYKSLNQQNRKRYLQQMINPTPFLVWFIENYPESFGIMKENPDFQFHFHSERMSHSYGRPLDPQKEALDSESV